MLALPNNGGMLRSINVHNVDLNILCDWIEASIVFDDEELSKSDIIDVLMEEQIYSSQDFAAERVEDAWAVISRRISYLSAPLGMVVSGNRISRTEEWGQFPAYGFCLALSCVELYSRLHVLWGNNYVDQGTLFEKLTTEALGQTLPGWTVKRVGWSSTDNPISLRDALPTVIADLNETEGAESQLYLTKTANDLGLDLIAFYSFGDRQASIPVLLMQCASGDNWKSKRHTPDIDLWKKVINFNSNPVRGFAIPFAFADDLKFRQEAAPVNGVFVDRYRLLKPFRQNNANVSGTLNAQLVDWVSPRIIQLPRATQ